MEINIEEIKLNTKIQGDETLKTAPNSSTSSTINLKKDATIEDELVEASELKDDIEEEASIEENVEEEPSIDEEEVEDEVDIIKNKALTENEDIVEEQEEEINLDEFKRLISANEKMDELIKDVGYDKVFELFDKDGDGKISKGAGTQDDHGDLKVIGNTTPRYFFGIDLNADWKGFDVRLFFQGVMKRDYWGTGRFTGYLFGVQGGTNQWAARGLTEHEDYFRAEPTGIAGHQLPANIDSYYPRPLFEEGSKNQEIQTRYLQDASYIRLKNFQIGYTLPKQWLNKVGLANCRIFVSGENLWTGTSLRSLFDPETIKKRHYIEFP